jgi:AraC-like DNA-binding protein
MPATPSMTVVEALGSMPRFIGSQLGERALERCLEAAALPSTIVDEIGTYIPAMALDQFLDRAAHLSGDDLFGLSLAQHLSVREYGAWGDYVLEAPDLISALRRATSIIHLHANNDKLAVQGGHQTTRVEYRFGERGGKGYGQIVLAAIGPVLSIPRHFLGASWKPRSIELDIPDQPTAQRIERILNCPVRSGRSCVAIELPNRDLGTPNPSTCNTWTTRYDVERECRGGPPRGIVPIVQVLILQRLGVAPTTLDDIARPMAISRRTLQRRLNQDGVDFRQILEAVKMRRAEELLIGSHASVSEISTLLDYSTASHFARAFRKARGTSPSEFRDAIIANS